MEIGPAPIKPVESSHSLVLPVEDASHVGHARRRAVRLGSEAGLDETRQGRLGIIATEAASNLVHHGGGGEIVLRRLERGAAGVELLAIDSGRGMDDVAQCLADGYSSAGTRGEGLGAIVRQADLFDIYSRRGQGAVLVAQVWSRGGVEESEFLVGGVASPMSGQEICGDAWAYVWRGNRLRFMVADGLGHGYRAAEASQTAVQSFVDSAAPIDALLTAMHQRLRRTRGAAAAIAELDAPGGEVRFWGVGNIAGAVLSRDERRNMVSGHGALGLELPRLQPFVYAWREESLLIMHSDGLTSRWRLDDYPGLLRRHPSLVAGVLYRDFRRTRDDVTVVVARRR